MEKNSKESIILLIFKENIKIEEMIFEVRGSKLFYHQMWPNYTKLRQGL